MGNPLFGGWICFLGRGGGEKRGTLLLVGGFGHGKLLTKGRGLLGGDVGGALSRVVQGNQTDYYHSVGCKMLQKLLCHQHGPVIPLNALCRVASNEAKPSWTFQVFCGA